MAERPLTDWDSGLFDCFEDPGTCCYGFWCYPFLQCTVTGRFGENSCLPLCDMCYRLYFGSCWVPVIVPPVALTVRSLMRKEYGIKGSLVRDIMASCCCVWCSWCQMHRELKHRKKTPVIINTQHQTVVMQPAPILIAPSYSPPVDVVQKGDVQAQ
ncbi:placenta-specific gene 8 protein [Nothobranchius furzeri]|nr:placenta-specific gene 8 protein [Nothobranchius furzeri]KAF7202679.1 placenta-specific gene 8 protein-like [Nothobranchius furzeri]